MQESSPPEQSNTSPSEPLPELEMAVARKVASLRNASGLTLRELGTKTGFSPAYLSRVERGETALSLSGLARLAAAFDVPASVFLEDASAHPPLVLCRAGKGKAVWLRGRHGIRVSLLADAKKNKLMEPILVEVDTASRKQPVVGHPGQEFAYVISGRCTYVVGTETYDLEPGDALYFDATIPHAAYPATGGPCRLISVVTSEDYQFHGNIGRFVDHSSQ